MKKSVIYLTILGILFTANFVMAEGFDNLSNLTPVQKQKLNQIQFSYKQDYNSLETRIMDYQSKLNQLQNSTEKTAQEKAIIIATYERNIATLKAQQNALKANAEKMYQTILTPAQFQQYNMQQTKAEDNFAEFLKGAKK